MKLEAEGQRAIVDPQSNEIHSAVSLLSLPDRKFLILSRSGTSYIQVMIVDSNRLVLECRDGSAEQHFRSARRAHGLGDHRLAKVRTMDPMGKVRAISTIGVGVLVVALHW